MPPATAALLRELLLLSAPPSPQRPPLHWRRSLIATAQLLLLTPPPDAEVSHVHPGQNDRALAGWVTFHSHLASPSQPSCDRVSLNVLMWMAKVTGQLVGNLAAAAAGELSGMRALAGGGLVALLPVLPAGKHQLVRTILLTGFAAAGCASRQHLPHHTLLPILCSVMYDACTPCLVRCRV